MKTLYESLLDNDLDTQVENVVDYLATAKKIFAKIKNIHPTDFYIMRDAILRGEENLRGYIYGFEPNKKDTYVMCKFIKHMHEKYGQEDIYTQGWCTKDYDLGFANKIYSDTLDKLDRKEIIDNCNLPLVVPSAKIDKWITGIDYDDETSWFFCTLKSMDKKEKDAWLELMKAVERYYN